MGRTKHTDEPAATSGHDGELTPSERPGERDYLTALRPRTFDEYVGQRDVVDNLRVSVQAARKGGWALDHFLFAGPPGLGKTTLAHVIATELGVDVHVTSGPAIDHKGKANALLTAMQERDILFIDEIHRLNPVIEEHLYPAMEDFRVDFFLGDGPHAKSVTVRLPRFTLLGATTRKGLLSSPLLDRFGFHWQLGYYGLDDMCAIVRRSAGLLELDIEDEGALEIAGRARGTPRIANRLLRRVRDFAMVEGDGGITKDLASHALNRLHVDFQGLDTLDRSYLDVIISRFDGGPVGIDAIAASLSEERGTLEEVVEPFLLQAGFITRTPRGRCATQLAFQHLGITQTKKNPRGKNAAGQGSLF